MTPLYAGLKNLMLINAAVGAFITLDYAAGYYFNDALFSIATVFAPTQGDALWRGVKAVSALFGVILFIFVLRLPWPDIMTGRLKPTNRHVSRVTVNRGSKRRLLTLALLAGPNAFAAQGTVSLVTVALHRRFGLDLPSLGHHLGTMSWFIGFLGFPVAAAMDSVARCVLKANIRLEIMLICLALALPFIGAANMVVDARQVRERDKYRVKK